VPEENRSDSPSRNPDSQSFAQNPRADSPEQGVMSNKPTSQPDQEEQDSEQPTGRVHWINHATFYLSVIPAVLTAGTIRVYYLQLNQIVVATRAAQDSAYAACISAKIARQTLLEYRAGEVDAHSVASGTVAQASAAIQGESGSIIMNTGLSIMPGSTPPSADPKDWQKLNLAFNYGNTGKSFIKNARFTFTVQLLPHGIEPDLSSKTVFHDTVRQSVIAPGTITSAIPAMIDKDNKFISSNDIKMDDFRSGNTYVVSFGRADYTDMFGVSHWQTFCGFFDNSPRDSLHHEVLHVKCAAYNRQDSNLLYSLSPGIDSKLPALSVEEIVCVPPKPKQ